MAKFVIAGRSDCPYYARAELLGEKLSINLPDFKLHKIVKTPEEWKEWLSSICSQRGWEHDKSPLVWRELIDRGGKGFLIGGANEFQEYAHGYYGIESKLISSDMSKIAVENKQCKIETEKEEKVYKALSQPINVCITNASSNVCYALLDSLCRGDVLGNSVEMIVHLFDTAEQTAYLEGVKMETEDLSHGLLRGVKIETSINEAFRDCSVIILLDEILQGDKTKDAWIKQNSEHFVNYAKVIDQVAKKSVKVLLAGAGPVNFSTTLMIKNAPSIPRQNFAAMSRLLENHSKSVIAERLHVNTAGVVDLIVWGNPNGENYIDVSKSRVHNYDGSIIGPESFSVSGPEMVFDRKWLDGEYLELVKTKRSRTDEALGHPAALSQAFAVNSTMMHWCNGSPSGQTFSLGVCSDGWYGIPKDMVFSFPVTFHPKGYWNVVQDIDLSEEVIAKIHETVKSLESELEVMFPGPKPPTPEGDVNTSTNQISEGEDKGTDSDQRLETIVEEKKENSEEETATATDGGKSTEEGEKTEGDKPIEEGEKAEDGEKTEGETEKKEEVAHEGSKEEQLPTE